ELLPDGADVLDHPGQQLPGDIADGIGRGREHVEAERGGAGEDVEDAGGVEAVGDLHHRLDSRDAGERTRAVVLDVDDGHGCSSPSACSVMALAAASSSAAKICAHSATRSPRILVPSAIWPIWPTAGSWICDFSNQPMGLPSTPNAKVRSSDSVAAAAASVMVASRSAKPATWSACADNSPDIAANTSLTTLPPLLSCASEPESPQGGQLSLVPAGGAECVGSGNAPLTGIRSEASTRAETEGFEPPVALATLAFKASAFGRSATSP